MPWTKKAGPGETPPAPPPAPSGSGDAYVVDLATYGIKSGIPVKPYVNSHYVDANNNIAGINAALKYAYDNGFNKVIFPRAEIAICYPNSIKTQANMTIDFNFSTLKVIYDSDVRSPLDTSPNPVYRFSGTVILCTTPDTHIVNLNLIGDRADRSFTTPDERNMEWSVGIQLGVGANRCSVKYCNLSSFMADAIYLSYSPYDSFDVGLMEFGDIDSSGTLIAGTTANSLRSTNFIALPANISRFTMIGLGYAPSTSIPNGMYDVCFYKADNTFISRKINIRTRDGVSIPKNATKIKLTWEGNGTLDDGCLPGNPPYWALLVKHGLSDNVVVEHNEIHRNHRGGIFLGTNNVMIQHNYFHDNAVPELTDIDGIPTFTDFTRYCISTEDNVGHNCKILNNVFDKTRMAVAIRGEFNEVSGNEFRNCTYGVLLYHLKHCIVDKNYFHYAAIGNYEYDDFDRDWRVTNNTFVGSGIGFTGNRGSIASVLNNHFTEGASFDSTVPVLNFRNNSFKGSKLIVQNPLTFIDGCSFIESSEIYVGSQTKPMDKIFGCTFVNSSIRVQNSPSITVKDSFFRDGWIEYSTGSNSHTLINCEVTNTTKSLVDSAGMLDIGSVQHSLVIRNCTLALGRVPLIHSMSWKDLTIKDSTIAYTCDTPLTRALQEGFGDITGAITITGSAFSSTPAQASHPLDAATSVTVTSTTYSNFTLTDSGGRI